MHTDTLNTMTTSMSIGTPANFINKDIRAYETYRACPVCFTPVRKRKDNPHGSYWAIPCVNPDCFHNGSKTWFNSMDACMIIRPEHRDITDNPLHAKNHTWYHISTLAPDEMEFHSNRPMHLGHAATVKAYYDSVPFAHGEKFFNGDFYVYQVRLKKDCVISDVILDDCDYWDDVELSLLDYVTPSAHVYVNRIEAPGSLSIIAKRCALEVVKSYPCGVFPDEIVNAVV